MSAFLTAVCTLSASPLSWACSYDGQFSNPFAESYPGALDVAMATQDALNTQTISVPTKLEGEKGLRRTAPSDGIVTNVQLPPPPPPPPP
ncbi:hypothetical protein K6U63_12170, partial [Vibrio fluvialis]|nr:hypothetical protein [Vibrio fluvialis]